MCHFLWPYVALRLVCFKDLKDLVRLRYQYAEDWKKIHKWDTNFAYNSKRQWRSKKASYSYPMQALFLILQV